MQAMDDMALLREYAGHDSEAAFETLVSRRIGFVYSAALRQVRDPHLTEEITQSVFILLAQKAGKISDKTILTGWLFKTTRFVALAQIRAEMKRARLEKEFQMQNEFQSDATDEIWNQMSPLLDEALAALGETDRQAVLLSIFENKTLAEVGNHLGTGEDTARKRVARALKKLHKFFMKRGVSSTTAIIAGVISANSVQAAPVALAKSVTAMAIAKGAAASISTLTLIKGALKIMAWTKMKMAAVISVGILLTAGTTTVTINKIEEHIADNSWRIPGFNSRVLDRVSPQVKILPSKIQSGSWGSGQYGKKMGTGVTVGAIVLSAYDWWSLARTICSFEEPSDKYDFIASLPSGNAEALQNEIRRKFGIVASRQTVETNVFVLTIKTSNAPGLRQSADQNGNGESINSGLGRLSCQRVTLSDLAVNLEEYVKVPIIDRTGLAKHFDINLTWPQRNWNEINLDILKQALINQLGLELMPSREPIEMLVVEKVK
jgi:uncharacterized protein (TIGR03435 family)